MLNPVLVPIGIDRGRPRRFRIAIVGIDLTGATFHAQVRMRGDASGAAIVDLPTVTDATTLGVRMAGTATVDGAITSYVDVQFTALPDGTSANQWPVGSVDVPDVTLAWDFFVTRTGHTVEKWAYGPLIVHATVTKEGSPESLVADPLPGEVGTTLAFDGANQTIVISDAGLLGSLVADAEAAAAAAAAAAAGITAARYLTGTTAPSSDDGNNGDFWDDTSAGAIYGPKTGGAWGVGRKYSGAIAASKLTWTDLNGSLPSWLTISRAQGSTDAFYDDAPGRVYNTVAANQPVYWKGGLWRGGSQKNWLPNSNAPITRTVSLSVGVYAVKYNGTGTLTTSLPGSGPAVGSGFGLVKNGSYQILTITTAGNVTFTTSGSVNWYSCDNDAGDPSKPSLGPLIVTGGSAVAVDAHVPVVGTGTLKTILQSGTGTFVIGTTALQPRTTGQARLISQNNNAQIDYNFTNGHVSIWDGVSGSIPEAATGEASPFSTSARTRFGMAFSGSTTSFGGGSHVPVSAPFGWSSGTTIVLGGQNSSLDTDPLNGVITRIGYSAARLSDADLYAEYKGFDLDTSPVKLPVFQAAKRAVLAGTADANLLVWMTSHGAGTNPTSNAKAGAWPALLSAKLAASGIPSASDSNFGNGGQTPSTGVSTYDSTVTFGSAVSFYGANVGGNGLRLQSAGGTIDKAVARLTDTFKVFAKRNVVGTNSISVGLTGGGSTTTFTLAANDNVQTFTITVPRLANNSFRIAWVSGDVEIVGWIPSDTLVPVVQVINGGYVGSTAGNNNSSDVLATVTAIAPVLTIGGWVTNDWFAGTALATYRTALASNFAVAQATGDLVVLTDPPSSTTALGVQAQYNAAEIGEAYKAGAAVIDLFGAMKGAYPAWNGDGFYFDGIHLVAGFGYQMVADLVGQTVK